jgi:hypothetical protein
LRLKLLVLFLLCVVQAPFAGAEDLSGGNSSYPYAFETVQERRDRIDRAKARVKEFIARAKAGMSNAPSAEEDEKERARQATERVLMDSSLQLGDIVSTSKGLFVFQGRNDRDRSRDDFVPLPKTLQGSPQRR